MKAIALLILMTLFAVLGSDPSHFEKTACHKTQNSCYQQCAVVIESTPEAEIPSAAEILKVTFLPGKAGKVINKPFTIFRPPISC